MDPAGAAGAAGTAEEPAGAEAAAGRSRLDKSSVANPLVLGAAAGGTFAGAAAPAAAAGGNLTNAYKR